MRCQHLGTVRYTVRSPGRNVLVHRCQRLKMCTESEAGITRQGSPIAVCATCPLYEPLPTECQRVFSRFFDARAWGDGESISGPGSSLDATARIRDALPILLQSLGVKSLLDAPCGDHHWMGRVDLGQITYIGADVVPQLIERNRQTYPHRSFERIDLTTDNLPACDAVLVRDCLVHLPYHEIGLALSNIVRSGANWLIATHFPGRVNHNIPLGGWRPLDLCAAPFRLPQPDRVIVEECTEGDGSYSDKALGVWSVDAIRSAVKRLTAAPRLSICLPVVKAYRDLWFTLQAIKLYHRDVHSEIEVIVLDNDPKGQPDAAYPASERDHSAKTKKLCEQYTTQFPCRYVHHTKTTGTAAAKQAAIEAARGEAVLVMDSHILLPSGVLRQLVDWWADQPKYNGLLTGPNLRDDIEQTNGQPALMGTHHEPGFRAGNWGQWAVDERVYQRPDPFQIPLAACGLFSFRRGDWLGFVPGQGYVPEEGTLHARYSKAKRPILCAPWLLWDHLYGHTEPPPYLSNREHRLAYYIRSSIETNSPPIDQIREHWAALNASEEFERALKQELAAATRGRTDIGATCSHRGEVIRFEQCQIGCPATRTAVPIYACDTHSECAPWRWELREKLQTCLKCELRPKRDDDQDSPLQETTANVS